MQRDWGTTMTPVVQWRARATRVMVLCLILWLTTVTSAEPQTVTPRDNALRRDAETYAKWHDVSVEEAFRRLQLQPDLGKLDADIVKRAADAYGGAWIQHQPDYGFVVCVTGNVESISAYLRSTPFAEMIEVRKVNRSLHQLEEAQLEAGKLMEQLGLPFESDINVYKNRAELYIFSKGEFRRALKANSGLGLPEGVVVIKSVAKV